VESLLSSAKGCSWTTKACVLSSHTSLQCALNSLVSLGLHVGNTVDSEVWGKRSANS